MSIEMMTLVWKQAPFEGGTLLVLLALADYANDLGESFPSVEALAEKARLGERQTQRAIASLIEAGWLEVSPGEGRGKRADRRTSLYRVTPERGDKMSPRLPPRGDIEGGHGVTSEAPRGDVGDTLNRQVDPSLKEPSVEEEHGDDVAAPLPAALCSTKGQRMAAAGAAFAAYQQRLTTSKNPQGEAYLLLVDLFGDVIPRWFGNPGQAVTRLASMARNRLGGDYVLLGDKLAALAINPPTGNPVNYLDATLRSERTDARRAANSGRQPGGDTYDARRLADAGADNVIIFDADEEG